MATQAEQVLLEDLCKRRFFFTPSFSIYGGVAGLYDLGPPGCAMKANMESIWRQHFIIYDNMFEISCTCLTPEQVLKTSGHVDRFTDLMVRNERNPEEVFRADKLIIEECRVRIADPKYTEISKDQLSRWELDVDTYSAEQCDKVLETLGTKGKHNLCFPFPFNLMFQTSIGPQGNATGYLRPETAQGMFVNFRRLLEQNGGKMPFAAAQIGLGFRNEIAPRQQLLRVREFPMAEIEHFVHPKKKNNHPKFRSSGVADITLPLLSKEQQAGDGTCLCDMTLGAAVDAGIINNETLAYFIGRVYMYLVKVGLSAEKIRFRQHRANEMAHYASDCWDAEALVSYGWIEIVGIADRAAYDLTVHSKASRVDLVAHDKLDPPVELDVVELTVEKSKFGKLFKKDASAIIEALEALPESDKLEIESELTTGTCQKDLGGTFGMIQLSRDMLSFKKIRKIIHEEVYTPSVIEPAFGMGRVLFCILEHSFRCRDDLKNISLQNNGLARCFLALPPAVAPIKVSILPITAGADEGIANIINKISCQLGEAGVSYKIDDSGQAIGRRYARTDEIGIPFGITVDFQSPKDQTVTLRERDSMEQIRLCAEKAVHVVHDLTLGKLSWTEARHIYPRFE